MAWRTSARTSAGTRRGSSGRALPVLLAVAVGVQISYPLVHGAGRRWLTLVIVVLFAAVCLLHAGLTRGVRTAVTVVIVTTGVGLAVEVVGIRTGLPFGSYAYSRDLGPQVLDVPLVVGLAWTMLAWPALLVARRLVRGTIARVAVGTWALASADLFLDPQLVSTGAWRWADPTPHLPGVDTVPLSNYAGWLVVAAVLVALLEPLVPDGRDGVALGLYLWLWVSWTLAQAVFLDLPASAGWGALGMGLVAVPLAVRLAQRRPVARAVPTPQTQ